MKRNHNYSVMSCFYFVEIQVLLVTTVGVSHIKIQKFSLVLQEDFISDEQIVKTFLKIC